MPEGHTVHRLARELAELVGQPVRATSPQGRFADEAARVDGAVLAGTDAWGKHLFLVGGGAADGGAGDGGAGDGGGWSVHVHLGMRGLWLRHHDPATPPRPQVRLRVATVAVAWDLIAPSTCELLDAAAARRVQQRLGPDPLRPDADVDAAVAALAADRRAIGAALLDQEVLAGVGNVFRAEALHEVGVDPGRPARSLDEALLRRLWDVLARMMAQAVEDGRIVTVDGPDRLEVPEDEARRVYKQAACRDCGAPVTVRQVGGRTAYSCPVEQPAHQSS